MHQQSDVLFLKDAVSAFCILDIFCRKSDVKYFQMPQVLLVVCHQHAELFLLKGKSLVSPDNVGVDVVGIIFSHQSRRNVDTYHLGSTLVDVFYHSSKTSSQRFVQSAAKETVNHKRTCFELWRIEVENDFREFHSFCFLEPFLVGCTVC